MAQTVCFLSFGGFDLDDPAFSGPMWRPNFGLKKLTASTFAELASLSLSDPPGRIEPSRDGATLYVGVQPQKYASSILTATRGHLLVVDAAAFTLTETRALPVISGGATSCAPHTNTVAVTPDGTKYWVYYAGPGFSVASDCGTVTATAYDHGIEEFNAITGARVRTVFHSVKSGGNYATPYPSSYIEDFANNDSGRQDPWVVWSQDGATAYVPAFSEDRLVVVGGSTVNQRTSGILALDVAAGTQTAFYDVGAAFFTDTGSRNYIVHTVSLSPDGTTLFCDNGQGRLYRVTLATGAIHGYYVGSAGSGIGTDYAGLGAVVASGTDQAYAADGDPSGPITYLDTSTGEDSVPSRPIQRLTAPSDSLQDVPTRPILYGGDLYGLCWYGVANPAGTYTPRAYVWKWASPTGGALGSVYTVPGQPWDLIFLVGAGLGPGGSGGGAGAVRHDAPRRPVALSGANYLASDDAGHTYTSHAVTADAVTDGSLLIDPASNLHRAVYSAASHGLKAWTATKDGEQSDWGSGQALTGLTGDYPVCVQHAQDRRRVLMAYLDGAALKCALSYDMGQYDTWQSPVTIVASGLDFSGTGRPGLCWLGESAVVAYGSGTSLLVRRSDDGGATWGAAVTVASAGEYSGLSLAGHAPTGALALAAVAGDGTQKVWTSGDRGATWTATAAVPPVSAGAGLGVSAWSGRVYFGVGKVSDSWGASWVTP